MFIMNELQKTTEILNKLEELNNAKFNSSEFLSLNNDFNETLKNIILKKNEQNKINFSSEDKKVITDIILKIENLEAKILPKADLVNSFSKHTI